MYQKAFISTATDYSKKRNWLSLPKTNDKAADLIYLYPSSCKDPLADTICSVDNPVMRIMA